MAKCRLSQRRPMSGNYTAVKNRRNDPARGTGWA